VDRVTNERLEALASWLEQHTWSTDIGIDTVTDIVAIFRESQGRRAQTCMTCKDWEPGARLRLPFGTCQYLCDAEDHERMSCKSTEFCCWWEAKEADNGNT